MADKVYIDEIGKPLRLDAGENISAATALSISVRKPDGTEDSWDALTGRWNKIANSIAGKIAGFEPVETNLSEYLTNKALDGMFIKVAEEEYKIRTEISARISPLLQKVFGSLDN